MTISKTSFRFFTPIYGLCQTPFFVVPMKLIYDRRLGYQYRRVSPALERAIVACCILNIVARLITFCWVHIAAGALNFNAAGVNYNQLVEQGALTGMNLLS